MTMSSITRENGVLKLVYPGGFVEIHNDPITAGEVMRRNPRHCVARPDVFKYPWIVVRPESVLRLGRVFFIVPYHTIHRLLQRTAWNHSSILQQQQSLEQNHDCREQSQIFPRNELNLNRYEEQVIECPREERLPKQQYTCWSSIRPTCVHGHVKKQTPRAVLKTLNPRHEEDREGHHHPKISVGCGFPALTTPNNHYHDHLRRTSLIKLPAQVKSQPAGDGSLKKQYPVECWPTMTPDCKNYPKELKPQTPSGSFVEEGVPSHFLRDDFNRVWVPQNDDRLELKSSQQVTKLKSCLKKHETKLAKSHGLRVTFAFPIDDDDKEK